MKRTVKIGLVLCGVACVLAGGGAAWAEEAPAPAPEAQPAPEAPPAPEAQPGPEARPAPAPTATAGRPGPAREIPETVVRFGRVETVLIENDDPESAIEFGQELAETGGDSAQLQLLMGACCMRLGRHADALLHFERARGMSESDPALQLHALYNIARARHAAGQLAEAAAAYDQYVAFARAHEELTAFVEEATRVAATLRGRLAEATPARRR